MFIQCNHCGVETDVNDKHQGKIQDMAEESGFEPIFITPVSSQPPQWYCDECLKMIRNGDPWS